MNDVKVDGVNRDTPLQIYIAIGLGGALLLTRFIETQLFHVTPTDPTTFVTVVVTLAAVSLVARYLPARRATRVDPTVALRGE